MKVLVTGAHFTPAQAVIEELSNLPGMKIYYIGRKYTLEGDKTKSVESKILPTLGVVYYSIVAGRLQRSFTRYTLWSLLKIPIGFLHAFYYLLKINPDVILSFGGYVSVPVVCGAWLLNKKIICHEQTLITSLANKINSYFATKILVSHQSSYSFPSNKVTLTGNPIRKELLTNTNHKDSEISQFISNAKRLKMPIIYITGGNQGSHIINQTIEQIISQLGQVAFVIHQTGDSKYQDFERLSNIAIQLDINQRYFVTKWVDVEDLRQVLENCRLAITRAGANVLNELAYFGTQAIFIPIPYLNHNEQMINAKYYEKQGLGLTIPQSRLSGEILLPLILEMIKKDQPHSIHTKQTVLASAAKRIAQEVYLLNQDNDT